MNDLVKVVPQIIRQLDWKKFAALSVKGETHTSYINSMQSINTDLKIFNREIINDVQSIQTALEEIRRDYKIVWIDVNMQIYAEVMCEAYQKKVSGFRSASFRHYQYVNFYFYLYDCRCLQKMGLFGSHPKD